jgi:hypothetical protein
MSQETADIVGTTGAAFTATITYGEIGEAYLEVTGTKTPLTVSGNKQAVTVPNLPSGESLIRLDIFWKPGDSNAIIDVGSVTSGTVTAANPKHRIDVGNSPGYIELFGK